MYYSEHYEKKLNDIKIIISEMKRMEELDRTSRRGKSI